MKAVLISINPKWCELIVSGKKTVEIRKSKPKLETPFKVYIYETKSSDTIFDGKPHHLSFGSGKVIGEFVCKKITDICLEVSDPDDLQGWPMPLTGLTDREMWEYLGNGKTGYGWHISDLVIYDKPRELDEFEKPWTDNAGKFRDPRPCACGEGCDHAEYDHTENCEVCEIDYDGEHCPFIKITRPPQSWCYVEVI